MVSLVYNSCFSSCCFWDSLSLSLSFVNFDHFNCNGSFCGPVLIYFTLIFLKVLYIEVCFIPRLGKFLATISSKKIMAFLSSFFFWDPYNVNVNLLDIVPKAPLGLSLFKNFFSALLRWVPLLCLQIHLFFLLDHLICCWTSLISFKFS